MTGFEAVERAIEAMKNGRMVILVDDHDRENEGDLVVAAAACTPAHINFMCTHGRGLVCLALTADRVDALRLPMMVSTSRDDMATAFTVSVEAREGVTTGISAADRARTVAVASDPRYGPSDLVSPGHIFPLRAQPGGVLVRSGHTEGAVDLARLAGFPGAGVICEIMRDDGEMARMPDLQAFARTHDLPMLSIADLIAYRLSREALVEEVAQGALQRGAFGFVWGPDWSVRTFRATVEPEMHYMAFIKGNIDDGGRAAPVLLRAQRANVLADVFGLGGDGGQRTRAVVQQLEHAGRGVLLYVVPSRWSDNNRAPGASAEPRGKPGVGLKPAELGFRRFGLGAQVLAALGLRRVTIVTDNPKKIIALAGFGIEVVGSTPIVGA